MPLYAIGDVRPSVPDDSWVAPSAELVGDVRLGHGVGVWFGAVARGDNTPIVVGDGTNIQELAVLHSDPGAPLVLGRGCTVGHRAILHGCRLGDGVLVGMGAIVLNGAEIGDECLVGAGALVTEGRRFPPRHLVLGGPAKAVRPLTDAEVAGLRRSAEQYAERGGAYAAGLRRVDG